VERRSVDLSVALRAMGEAFAAQRNVALRRMVLTFSALMVGSAAGAVLVTLSASRIS
jgi:hypothetical protein